MEEILGLLKRNIISVLTELDEESISLDSSLKELGANSIDRMDIIVKTLEDLKINVPPTELGKVNNIREIIELLASKVNVLN